MAVVDQSVYYRREERAAPADVPLAPGGYRPSRMLHHVPRGHRVRFRKQELQIVHRKSQRIVSRHDVGVSDAPIPGLGSAWVTGASWQNPSGATISQIDTTWTVPPDPAIPNAGQTIFLFNGLQNLAGSNLLQPVLQWGTSKAGGGQYWTISNWYIDDSGHVCYSDCLQVLSGQVITGIVSLGQESNGLCTYTVGFDGYPDLDLSVSNVTPSAVAVEVLEAYQMGNINEYPDAPSTVMSSIFIAAEGNAPHLNWNTQNDHGGFGEHTTIVSSANPNGELEIFY